MTIQPKGVRIVLLSVIGLGMPYGAKCDPLSVVSNKIMDFTQLECHVTLAKRNSSLKPKFI